MAGDMDSKTKQKRPAPTMIRWTKALGKWRATAPSGQKAAAQLVFLAAEMIWDSKGGELKNNTADVCEAVGIPRASYYRWMNILKEAGFLDHKSNGKYINLIATFPPGTDDGAALTARWSSAGGRVVEDGGLLDRVARMQRVHHMTFEDAYEILVGYPPDESFETSARPTHSEHSTSETTSPRAKNLPSTRETELSPEETDLSTSETEVSTSDNPCSSNEVRNEGKMYMGSLKEKEKIKIKNTMDFVYPTDMQHPLAIHGDLHPSGDSSGPVNVKHPLFEPEATQPVEDDYIYVSDDEMARPTTKRPPIDWAAFTENLAAGRAAREEMWAAGPEMLTQ